MMLTWPDNLCRRPSGINAEGPAPARPAGGKDSATRAAESSAGVRLAIAKAILAVIYLLAGIFIPSPAVASIQGDTIVNRARLSTFEAPLQHTDVSVKVIIRTQSIIEFLGYSPGAPGATNLQIPPTYYRDNSSVTQPGSFNLLSPPARSGSLERIDLGQPLPLVADTVFHAGEPVFIRLTDRDQNVDRNVAETVIVTITEKTTGDTEVLRLTESGPDTGVFLGYFQTGTSPVQHYNGEMTVAGASEINANYIDIVDGSDTSADAALVDPFGIVFDTITGQPVNGAVIELLDAATGLGATVLGDNGQSGNIYPNRIISGGTATDTQGNVYSFPQGGYRFPFVTPGNYILRVTPPDSHTSPSTVSTARIQTLPGAPFTILEPGSRGEVFTVPAGPAIRLDIPLDPRSGTLWLRKTAGKSIVSVGEFLGYEITVENTDQFGTLLSTVVTDKLPPGFRYQKGSARINNMAAADPTLSADGGTMTFNVGSIAPKSSLTIRYVVAVGAGSVPGAATNTVSVSTNPPAVNNTALATVQVQEPFMRGRSIIMGRVVVGTCGTDPDSGKRGMEGIGIYLEDGTFVITDRMGMYHFEGIQPDSHVVQLDLDSIPDGYEILPCERNSRFAGRSYSQFVDLQGGTLWRADFYLGKKELKPVETATATDTVAAVGMPAEKPSERERVIVNDNLQAVYTYNGEIGIEMTSSRSGDTLDYRIPLQSFKVPLQNLVLTVKLPAGVTYLNGSSSFKGQLVKDPEITGQGLVYRLEDATQLWIRELQFRAVVDTSRPAGELASSAVLKFDTPAAKNILTPEVINILTITREEKTVPLPLFVFHPHFPTFGAELSDEDRRELDRLVSQLEGTTITRIDVAGHTDIVRIAPRSRGVYKDNTELSYARARSVGRYLLPALRLPPSALHLTGSGEFKPVATNRTATGRALNRRVEVKITALKKIETVDLKIIKERSGIERLQTTAAPVEVVPAHDAPEPESQDVTLPADQEVKDSPATAIPLPSPQESTADVAPPEQPAAPSMEDISAVGANAPRAELKMALNDGLFLYRVRLRGAVEQHRQFRARITLPKSLLYMNGTSSINGTQVSDPEITGSILVYHFSATASTGQFDLKFQAVMDGDDSHTDVTTSADIVLLDGKGEEKGAYRTNNGTIDSLDEINTTDSPSPAPAASAASASPSQPENDAEAFREKIAPAAQSSTAEPAPAPKVSDEDGIVGPVDGTVLATRINSVRVVLASDLRPVLLLDGREIPADRIGYQLKDRDSNKTLYTYIGVDFGEPGQHLLHLKGVDPFGQVRRDKQAVITRSGDVSSICLLTADGNVADGRSPVRIRVQLLDNQGKSIQATAELTVKEGSLTPFKGANQLQQEGMTGNARNPGGTTVTVDSDGWVTFQPVNASGLYRAVLAYNRAELELETYVQPKMRDWILVGIAEGTAGYNTLSGHMESIKGTGVEENFYNDERLAFYAKGSIKGEWLLTMAYDSTNRNTGISDHGLFQTIDPNTYYTIYSDATIQQYDAPSARKLYLKLERDQFYAMFGDYDTGLTVTELSRYNRRMNGFKSELRARNFELALFGSETGQAFTKDELRGDGTSGLYRLSRTGLVINSETITIEIRDRFKSEMVISTRNLTRFVDYSIDYDAGTLLFKEPVPSRDPLLNPVYIVVDYEVNNGGSDALTYGGRAGARLADGAVKAGMTYIREGQISGDNDLFGVDATAALLPGTRLRAEFATTNNDAGINRGSGNAYIAEILHGSSLFDAKAYFRQQDELFGLGQQKGSEAGTRKAGVDLNYRLSDRIGLSAQAYRQYNLITGATRNLYEAMASYLEKSYAARLGLRYAVDELEDGSNQKSLLMTAGGSWHTQDNRLNLRLDHEQALNGSGDNVDHPTRTTFGADFRVNPDVTLFAQEEITYSDTANTSSTRIGIKAVPWVGGIITSSLAQDIRENNERTFATVGLAQKWQLDQHWIVDGGLDHGSTLRKKEWYQFNDNVPSSVPSEDFTAVSLGANYIDKRLTWSNRVEYRTSTTEDKWGVMSGVINEKRVDWGWTGRLQLFHRESTGGATSTDADLRFGLAYRPPVTNWIILDRLDLIASDNKNSGMTIKGKRIVNSLNANYRPDKKTQISLQYGAKYVLDTIDERDYSGYTDLVGIEGRYDVTPKWDVGMRGSMLHSWDLQQYSYSLAPTVGCNVMDNVWISLGYNLLGFEDMDFSQGEFTSQGPFVQFRFKFDQNTVKDGLKALNQ